MSRPVKRACGQRFSRPLRQYPHSPQVQPSHGTPTRRPIGGARPRAVASTVPTIWWPRTRGGEAISTSPSSRCRSVRHTPHACTRSSNSPGPGSGIGSSTSRSGAPDLLEDHRAHRPRAGAHVLTRRTARRSRTASGRAASARAAPPRARPRRSRCRAAPTITPKRPAATASSAATPKRVASTRSKAIGRAAALHVAEDRDAGLEAGARSISPSSVTPMPPRRAWPNASVAVSARVSQRALARRRALGDDDDREAAARARGGGAGARTTSSMSNGRSGTRIASAPPAMPACVAIQPAWRPITSTTITRLCDSAVVCRRSIASVTICTAVWKPNGDVGAAEVVVDRLRHAHDRHARRGAGAARRRACPRRRSGSARRRRARRACAARAPCRRRPSAKGFVREVPRIVPPRGEDAGGALQRQLDRVVREHARPAVAKAEEARAPPSASPRARRRGSRRSDRGSRRRR